MSPSIVLGPAATIRTAEQLQSTLADAFQQDGAVTIDASELQEIDLSFVQVIEAARKTAIYEGKPIYFVTPANDAVRSLLSRSGTLTDAMPEDLDFWLHGEIPQ